MAAPSAPSRLARRPTPTPSRNRPSPSASAPPAPARPYLAMAKAVDALAYFDHPSSSNGPTEAVNGRLEHLRGIALGIRNLASSSPAASSTQDASRTASLQKTAAQIAAIVAVILTPKWVLRPRRRSLCLRRRESGRKTSQTSGHA